MTITPAIALSWLALLAAGVLVQAVSSSASPERPSVKIVIVAGDDNVEGYANVHALWLKAREDDYQGGSIAQTSPYARLVNKPPDFAWEARNDVYVTYEHARHTDWWTGPLSIDGNFAHNASFFGPEIGLGQIMGDAMRTDDVVIVKAGWTDKTLGRDFRPPSAVGGVTGFDWFRMLSAVERTMTSLDEVMGNGDYANARIEIAGFVWWHGYAELFAGHATDLQEYSANLAALIRDVRAEYGRNLPFVIAKMGGSGAHASQHELQFRQRQQDVCDSREFHNNVICVDTHALVTEDGPKYGTNTHYYGRPDVMMEISRNLGQAVLDLMVRNEVAARNGGDGNGTADDSDNDRSKAYVFLWLMLAAGLGVLGYSYVQRTPTVKQKFTAVLSKLRLSRHSKAKLDEPSRSSFPAPQQDSPLAIV